MELLKNVKKWMHKLLRVFLVLSFGSVASGGKSGLPQALEREIKTMLGGKEYVQLQRGFIRKEGFSQNFCQPLRACREKHSVPHRGLRIIPCHVGNVPAEPYVLLKWICLSGLSVCPSEAIFSPSDHSQS